MAGILQHLRSSTLDKRPNPASMVDGQVAINYASGAPGMFFKNSNGDLVKVGPVHVGSGAPNASPASGGTAGNSIGEQWLDNSGGTYVFKVWDGSAWRSEAGEFVNATGDTMTGDLVMDNANIVFEGSTDDGFETTLTVTDPTADRTITLPNVTGTVVTTGDTGTVTSTMIADGTIVNADINASAAIALSKLATGALPTAITVASANIVDGTIVNADVNASAAIAGTKIDPDFGSQTVETTGVFSAAGGAAATPSITFTGDLNTGIYSPGADQVAISTSGTQRINIEADGDINIDSGGVFYDATNNRLGIGTTSPGRNIEIYDSSHATLSLTSDDSGQSSLFFADTDTNVGQISYFHSENAMTFRVNDGECARIDSSGRLGIGTSSPSSLLHLNGSSPDLTIQDSQAHTTSDGPLVQFQGRGPNATNYNFGYIRGVSSGANNAGILQFATNSAGTQSVALTIDSSQRVGVGTTSPASELHVADNGIAEFRLENTSAAGNAQIALIGGNQTNPYYVYTTSDRSLVFQDFSAERARIDSSGRLLVGTSSWSSDRSLFVVEGNQIDGTSFGRMAVARGAADVANGTQIADIIFADSSQSIGASIAAFGEGTWATNDYPARLVFSTTADGASSPTERMRIESDGKIKFPSVATLYQAGGGGIYLGNSGLFSTDGSGTIQDNTKNIGSASFRWATVYAGTGTINTSDANLKQDIAALEQAELQVASTIKGLIKKYRYIDAVASKGDDARIHVGVIAQDVEQAFVTEGLDPRRYGLFCEDTLEDGSKRLGIRYDELLAFVIAAL